MSGHNRGQNSAGFRLLRLFVPVYAVAIGQGGGCESREESPARHCDSLAVSDRRRP